MYEVQLTPEIKAIYQPYRADGLGTKDNIEIDFFILGVEVKQPGLEAALREKYEPELWKDLKARQEIAVLDRMLDDVRDEELCFEPSEWLTGGIK